MTTETAEILEGLQAKGWELQWRVWNEFTFTKTFGDDTKVQLHLKRIDDRIRVIEATIYFDLGNDILWLNRWTALVRRNGIDASISFKLPSEPDLFRLSGMPLSEALKLLGDLTPSQVAQEICQQLKAELYRRLDTVPGSLSP